MLQREHASAIFFPSDSDVSGSGTLIGYILAFYVFPIPGVPARDGHAERTSTGQLKFRVFDFSCHLPISVQSL